MIYRMPIQARAIETENRFLNALNDCLVAKSFEKTSIDEIAARAGLQRGAFLKRFGSKEEALIVLFSRYCDRASAVIEDIHNNLQVYASAAEVCYAMSTRLEKIQLADFGANRAMQENFLDKLEAHALTKRIFHETVGLMKSIQRRFFVESACTSVGAYAATQLLVSTNYNYVLRAMPALPKEYKTRHQLISHCMCVALVL